MFSKIFKINIALLSLILLPGLGFSAQHLTIINNFPRPLNFKVEINPSVFPEKYRGFTMTPPAKVKFKLLRNNLSAYVHADNGLWRKRGYAYFSVTKVKNRIIIRGYLMHGVAYSWKNGTIIFCSEKVYAANNNSCPK